MALVSERLSLSSISETSIVGGNPARKEVSFADTGPKPRHAPSIALESFALSCEHILSSITSSAVLNGLSLSCPGGYSYGNPGRTRRTRLLFAPTRRNDSVMMPSATRMILLYLPTSSSTSVFVTILPPAARVSISIDIIRSSVR